MWDCPEVICLTLRIPRVWVPTSETEGVSPPPPPPPLRMLLMTPQPQESEMLVSTEDIPKCLIKRKLIEYLLFCHHGNCSMTRCFSSLRSDSSEEKMREVKGGEKRKESEPEDKLLKIARKLEVSLFVKWIQQ